ncbi:MAG: hypothetical protein LPK07_04570 [Hymenobacteraceae bacterium]|nr:hypothetical protein [Hymenobacteraceae bacterium]MDX5480934.1 hypothetical protein [Hymenobacteraceae bacterium]
MKKILLALSLLVTFGLSSCEKEDFGTFNSDNRPEVPVTFPGTTTHGFNPYITKSISGDGVIEFTLSIPENSGRTIREISRVAAGGTGVNAGSLNLLSPTGTPQVNYIASPIAGNGTSVKFRTTLAEFSSKSTANADLVKAGNEIAFMFLVTLDNGNTIIPVQVRVRLTA